MSAESELRVKYSSKKHWVLQRRAMSPPGVYSRINPTKQRELPKQSAASEGGTGSKYLRTKSSGRRPIEILDDDDEFFPTRQAKRNSSQPTKKATVEVQIPAYRQAGNTTGYQGTSNMDPSRPRNKIRGNGDSQPSAEVSGYQGTPNNESSWPKNKIWGNGDSELPGEASGYQDTLNKECSPPKNGTETNGYSQLPAEPCRFVKYFPSAQSRTPTNSSNGTHSAHPPGARDRKMANSRLGNEIRSSVTSSSASGADGEDSAEEEIVTAGAQATLNNARPARTAPRPNIVYEGHRESVDREPSDEESEESESEESEAPSVEPEDSKPRHARFPPVEELPDWFPENIKQMYRVDRHGGALSYKVSPSSLSNVTFNK